MPNLTPQHISFFRVGVLNDKWKTQVKVQDWVLESSSNTGTGIVIGLASMTGYVRFGNVLANREKVYYTIESGGSIEIGEGSYLAGNRLSRDTPLYTLVSGVYNDTNPPRISLVARRSKVSMVATAYTLKKLEESIEARSLLLLGSS